ncbi:MAG: M48 family metallopeptidase [Myxococcales bacterium]|nr:M48 family metallopeptidase [Myxococcales bacterium]
MFDKRLQGGRAGAQLTVDAHGVHASTTAGDTFDVPARDCQLELGGASGRMWFCRTPDRQLTIYSEARGFAEALASLPNLSQPVAELRRHRRAESRRGVLFLLAALGMLIALGIAGYFGLDYAGRAAIEALPREADERIGRLAINSMDLGGPTVHDKTVTDAVNAIVARLAEHAPGDFEYQVRVLDAETVNAFALPGGQIVVYTGLIAKAEALDEVAGVLAHEIAHVTQRHGLQRIAQSLGVAGSLELLLGDLGGLSAIAVELMRAGALTSYGRDQEREADEQGVLTMHASGLDADGIARFFQKLQKEQDEMEIPEIFAWMSSHPDLDERIANVRAQIDSLGPVAEQPLEIDWDAVRRAVGPDAEAAGSAAEADATEKAPEQNADSKAGSKAKRRKR